MSGSHTHASEYSTIYECSTICGNTQEQECTYVIRPECKFKIQIRKAFIDAWFAKYHDLQEFSPTHHKMEWQASTTISSIWEGVIQLRPSGIRVKTPTCFPALVAMVQIPIVGKYRRRLTVEEAGKLQSFPCPTRDPNQMDKKHFLCDANDQQAYKQFGNSVNVDVIRNCAERLFEI